MAPTYQFTAEDGRKGAIARNAKAETQRQALRTRSAVVWAIASEVDDLSPAALRSAMDAIAAASDGLALVTPTDALDVKRLAETAEILHRIHRLASGQSTANVAHAQLTDAEREAKRAELRARLEGGASTDDGQGQGPSTT